MFGSWTTRRRGMARPGWTSFLRVKRPGTWDSWKLTLRWCAKWRGKVCLFRLGLYYPLLTRLVWWETWGLGCYNFSGVHGRFGRACRQLKRWTSEKKLQQVPPLRCAPVRMRKGRAVISLSRVAGPGQLTQRGRAVVSLSSGCWLRATTSPLQSLLVGRALS